MSERPWVGRVRVEKRPNDFELRYRLVDEDGVEIGGSDDRDYADAIAEALNAEPSADVEARLAAVERELAVLRQRVRTAAGE